MTPHRLGGHGLRIVRLGRGQPDPDMVRAREQIGLATLASWLLGEDDNTPLHPDWKRTD